MKGIILRVCLPLIVAAGLTGCGGTPAQPLTQANTAAVMNTLVTTVLSKLPTSNNPPALPEGGMTTSAVPGVMAADCETTTGDLTDADTDSIAVAKTSTFDCTDFPSGESLFTRKGYYKVMDLDDSVSGILGGMRVEYDVSRWSSESMNGELFSGHFKGFWDYKGDGGNVDSTSSFSGGFELKSARYDIDYEYGYKWNWSLRPTDPAAAWTSGSVSYGGEYTMSGKFVTEDAAGNHTQQTGSFAISYKTKNMTYDSTCTRFYKSGSLIIDDSNGNIMELRYACTTVTFYVNGQQSDWYTPQ